MSLRRLVLDKRESEYEIIVDFGNLFVNLSAGEKEFPIEVGGGWSGGG